MIADQHGLPSTAIHSDYAELPWDTYASAARERVGSLHRRLLDGERLTLGCVCHPRRCHADFIRSTLLSIAGEGDDGGGDDEDESIELGDDEELALDDNGQDQDDGQDAIREPDMLSAGAIDLPSASEGPSLPASTATSLAHVAAGAARPRRVAERPSYREARSYRQGGSRDAPGPPEGQPGAHGPSG